MRQNILPVLARRGTTPEISASTLPHWIFKLTTQALCISSPKMPSAPPAIIALAKLQALRMSSASEKHYSHLMQCLALHMHRSLVASSLGSNCTAHPNHYINMLAIGVCMLHKTQSHCCSCSKNPGDCQATHMKQELWRTHHFARLSSEEHIILQFLAEDLCYNGIRCFPGPQTRTELSCSRVNFNKNTARNDDLQSPQAAVQRQDEKG